MNALNLPVFLTMLSCVSKSFTSATLAPNTCPQTTISVRLPPDSDPALNGSQTTLHSGTTFVAPPLNYWTGTWYQTNTSNALYRGLSNLQWDPRLVLPSCTENTTTACPPGTLDGTMTDLTTWAVNSTNVNGSSSDSSYYYGARGGGGRPVASLFGWDTPRRLNKPEAGPEFDGVYDLTYPGDTAGGFVESWSVLYWGNDAKDVPFIIAFESNPALLDAFTRSPEGPDHESLAKVLDALIALGDEQITGFVKEMGPTKWDYQLGNGSAICGKSCMENKAE